MSFPSLTRRLLLASLPLVLVACGGGSDDKPDPQWRVLNLSEVAALDVYLDTERKLSGAQAWQMGGNQTVGVDTYDVELRRAGTDLALARGERGFRGLFTPREAARKGLRGRQTRRAA